MLSARPSNNIQSDDANNEPTNKLKLGNKLKNSTNTRNIIGPSTNNKPKPLHASTNTIHAKQQQLQQNQRFPLGLKADKRQVNNSNIDDEIVKKKIQVPKQQPVSTKPVSSTITTAKIDENDVATINESYDPLLYVYPFDEELYQKVLKLELADDGLPKCSPNDSFDF